MPQDAAGNARIRLRKQPSYRITYTHTHTAAAAAVKQIKFDFIQCGNAPRRGQAGTAAALRGKALSQRVRGDCNPANSAGSGSHSSSSSSSGSGVCVLWCGMLYLLRLRLYRSLHMSGLKCYAHPPGPSVPQILVSWG